MLRLQTQKGRVTRYVAVGWRPDAVLPPPGDATERWASAVACVIAAPRDIPTLGDWATLLSVSRRCLCNWCALANVPTKASLDLARLARTVRLPSPDGWRPEAHLLISEPRTVLSLLDRAGVRHHYRRKPPAMSDVLSSPASGIPTRAIETLLRYLRVSQGLA
jgi:hypothetical protein